MNPEETIRKTKSTKKVEPEPKETVREALYKLWGTDDRARIVLDRDELAVRREADRQRRRADEAESLVDRAIELRFADEDEETKKENYLFVSELFTREGIAPKFWRYFYRDLYKACEAEHEKESRSGKLYSAARVRGFLMRWSE